MTDKGYEVAHIDELEELPINKGEFVLATGAAQVPDHRVRDERVHGGRRAARGRGAQRERRPPGAVCRRCAARRATFTLDGEEIDAPAGTLVFAQPGTKRGRFAAEDGLAVLGCRREARRDLRAVSPGRESFAAGSYADQGQMEKAREIMDAALAARPAAGGSLHYACLLALNDSGPRRRSRELQRAHELEPKEVGDYAGRDSDLDSIRDDPRVSAIAGQTDARRRDARVAPAPGRTPAARRRAPRRGPTGERRDEHLQSRPRARTPCGRGRRRRGRARPAEPSRRARRRGDLPHRDVRDERAPSSSGTPIAIGLVPRRAGGPPVGRAEPRQARSSSAHAPSPPSASRRTQ